MRRGITILAAIGIVCSGTPASARPFSSSSFSTSVFETQTIVQSLFYIGRKALASNPKNFHIAYQPPTNIDIRERVLTQHVMPFVEKIFSETSVTEEDWEPVQAALESQWGPLPTDVRQRLEAMLKITSTLAPTEKRLQAIDTFLVFFNIRYLIPHGYAVDYEALDFEDQKPERFFAWALASPKNETFYLDFPIGPASRSQLPVYRIEKTLAGEMNREGVYFSRRLGPFYAADQIPAGSKHPLVIRNITRFVIKTLGFLAPTVPNLVPANLHYPSDARLPRLQIDFAEAFLKPGQWLRRIYDKKMTLRVLGIAPQWTTTAKAAAVEDTMTMLTAMAQGSSSNDLLNDLFTEGDHHHLPLGHVFTICLLLQASGYPRANDILIGDFYSSHAMTRADFIRDRATFLRQLPPARLQQLAGQILSEQFSIGLAWSNQIIRVLWGDERVTPEHRRIALNHFKNYPIFLPHELLSALRKNMNELHSYRNTSLEATDFEDAHQALSDLLSGFDDKDDRQQSLTQCDYFRFSLALVAYLSAAGLRLEEDTVSYSLEIFSPIPDEVADRTIHQLLLAPHVLQAAGPSQMAWTQSKDQTTVLLGAVDKNARLYVTTDSPELLRDPQTNKTLLLTDEDANQDLVLLVAPAQAIPTMSADNVQGTTRLPLPDGDLISDDLMGQTVRWRRASEAFRHLLNIAINHMIDDHFKDRKRGLALLDHLPVTLGESVWVHDNAYIAGLLALKGAHVTFTSSHYWMIQLVTSLLQTIQPFLKADGGSILALLTHPEDKRFQTHVHAKGPFDHVVLYNADLSSPVFSTLKKAERGWVYAVFPHPSIWNLFEALLLRVYEDAAVIKDLVLPHPLTAPWQSRIYSAS